MADLNKLRQNNPHWQPEDGDLEPLQSFIEDQEAAKQMAEGDNKPRFTTKEHLNKVHNKLWGENYYKNEEMNPSKYTQKDIEQTKRSIIDKILRHFDDTLFEIVCEEMSESYLFQSSNYLTEAGYDMFEDEWFEFYHEHHGDILFQVKTEINM